MQQGPSPFNQLPTDLLNYIFSFIQHCYFVGPNLLHRVCQKFHPRFNTSLIDRKPSSLAKILTAPLQATEAVYILNNPTMRQHLSRKDLIHLASLHPTLVEQIKDKVNVYELPLLLKNHSATALSLWATGRVWDQKVLWAKVGKYHIPLANLILDKLIEGLQKGQSTKTISEWFPHIPENLTELGSIHLEVAERIYHSELLQERMGTQVLELGIYHLTIALKLFNVVKIQKAAIIERCYIQMAIKFPEIAQQLIAIPNILKKLDQKDIILLATKYRFIAEQLAEDPKLRVNVELISSLIRGSHALSYIAGAHEWLAAKVLADETLLATFNGIQLALLIQNYSWAWQQIRKNPVLFSKLSAQEFAYAGANIPEIAHDIMKSTDCLDKFTVAQFKIFIEKNSDVALAALKMLDPGLRSILEWVPVLFNSHTVVALEMLKSPLWMQNILTFPVSKLITHHTNFIVKDKLLSLKGIVKKITKTDLKDLAFTHTSVSQRVTTEPALLVKFNNEKRGQLNALQESNKDSQLVFDCALKLQQKENAERSLKVIENKPEESHPFSLSKIPESKLVSSCSSPEKLPKRNR